MAVLDMKMPNGASVSDWLGTAGSNAGVGLLRIKGMRREADHTSYEVTIDNVCEARNMLEKAAQELNEVATFLDRMESGDG